MVTVKKSVPLTGFVNCHPVLLMIIGEADFFCFSYGQKLQLSTLVTTLEIDLIDNRKSFTHRQGRAFDVSILGWSEDFITRFKANLTSKFAQYGAVTLGKKAERLLILDHDSGSGRHLHVQIDARFRV